MTTIRSEPRCGTIITGCALKHFIDACSASTSPSPPQPRPPPPVQKALPRREQNLIRQEPDDDDHQHDADDLVHVVQFAAVVEEMPEPEAGEDGDVDSRRHQRAPGEGPALLHAADQERQRRRQDHAQPLIRPSTLLSIDRP